MKMQVKSIRRTIERTGLPAMLLAMSALWVSAGEAEAQIGFAVEGRAAVTLPQGDLSDGGAETGIGLGAELQANFRPNLTAYLGLHRHAFGCETGCALGDSPRSTGVGTGLKYTFHAPGDVFAWGRGGVVYNTFANDDASSDRGIGFEVGAGADMPIATRIYLVPNLGFVSHDTGNGFATRFFTLGIGVHYHIN